MSEGIIAPNQDMDPEDEFLETDKIPDHILSRLEEADRKAELARSTGLSTLTSDAQQSLLDHILGGGMDEGLKALEGQTRNEIKNGIFDINSLRPELRDLLVPRTDNDHKEDI